MCLYQELPEVCAFNTFSWYILSSLGSLEDTHLLLDSPRQHYHAGNLCHMPALVLVCLFCDGAFSSLRLSKQTQLCSIACMVQSHLLASHFHSRSTKTNFQQNVCHGPSTDRTILRS